MAILNHKRAVLALYGDSLKPLNQYEMTNFIILGHGEYCLPNTRQRRVEPNSSGWAGHR
jgi:hypothetical protein